MDAKSRNNLSQINSLEYETPYFLYNENAVLNNLNMYKNSLPKNTEICYAMKANFEEEVLKTLVTTDCSFEVSSIYELSLLQNLGLKPDRIIYGTAVKPANAIQQFHEFGVDRFAFDSIQELEKIAEHAPSSRVYLRVLVDDEAHSVFSMSEKFGTSLDNANELLIKARQYGLVPYGISFNVGSQARNVEAWANGIRNIYSCYEQLRANDIELQVLNIGGGFPFSYQPDDGISDITEIGKSIKNAIANMPPDVTYIVEPGRGLVADAYLLVTSVFAKNHRPNGHWIYSDAGAYNALLEAMSYQGSIRYRVRLLRDSVAPSELYILTGPTGDSLDVIGRDIALPSDVQVGDKLIVSDAGAYSFPLITKFNGFPKPPVHRA